MTKNDVLRSIKDGALHPYYHYKRYDVPDDIDTYTTKQLIAFIVNIPGCCADYVECAPDPDSDFHVLFKNNSRDWHPWQKEIIAESKRFKDSV